MMVYPSRMRPRSGPAGPPASADSSNNILGTAKATAKKLGGLYQVAPRNNPLDERQLQREELSARREFGHAKRYGHTRAATLAAWFKWVKARARRLRLIRAFSLFFFHYGTVMAAGAAYMLFFSVAAMLWAGFSMAGIIIGGNEEYQDLLIEAVDNTLPGLLGEGGLVAEPRQLFQLEGFSLSLGLAVAVALVTSLSWVHGLRSGIRSIWERPLMAENVLLVKLKDLGLLVVLGAVAISSAVLGFLGYGLIRELAAAVGWESAGATGVLIQAASLALSFGLDMMIAVLLMRVASRLVMPPAALWQAALIAGVGAFLLRLGSSQLLQNFADSPNPLLNTFGTVLGVFFYFYLFGLVYLVAASWGAIAAADRGKLPRS